MRERLISQIRALLKSKGFVESPESGFDHFWNNKMYADYQGFKFDHNKLVAETGSEGVILELWYDRIDFNFSKVEAVLTTMSLIN